MKLFIREHPFQTVIIVALGLRILAALFSQGYMAHDDHFETARIAWSWHHDGMFLPDGTLRWEGKPEIGVSRSAVYNLFLLGIMKTTSAFGIEYLDIHMYFNRMIHALLSMLPVIFGFLYLRDETDQRTALVGGLLLSAHFLMPYISVRNLIEMAAADLLLPALYFSHRSMKNNSDRDTILAAVFGGISFMIRFQVGLALVSIPIAMIIMSRKWRHAVIFSIGILVMVAMQGLLDIYTHGKFLDSLWIHIVGNITVAAPLTGPWYKYILLIFGIMIPPFSILFIGSIFSPKVIRNHLVLWLPAVVFVAVHSLVEGKQERYIIPIFPVIIVLGCVGIYYMYQSGGWYYKWKKLRVALWGWFWILNIVILILFTFNYAHRGAVDSLVYLSRQSDVDGVIFDCTERKKFIPYSYWDYRKPNSLRLTPSFTWENAIESGEISAERPPSYVVIFSDGYPDRQLEYLHNALGKYQIVHHGKPSLMDLILHRLNPKYNQKNETWVLKLEK